MTKLSLFLGNAGKSFWRTEEETVTKKELLEEYLEPNGFCIEHIHFGKDSIFVKVDPSKMNLSDFYSWEEAMKNSQKPECWRNFYFFKDDKDADWFTSKQMQNENEVEGKEVNEIYADIFAGCEDDNPFGLGQKGHLKTFREVKV